MLTTQNDVWVGRAVLALEKTNPKWDEGFRGAFVNVACSAKDIAQAVDLLRKEFEESNYILTGLEGFFLTQMLDRPLTDYEKDLVDGTKEYPVQFKNVHMHKADA
jgi:hypothetical protein